jgi:hypothetical protein
VVKTMDLGARLLEFEAAFAIFYLCDLEKAI